MTCELKPLSCDPARRLPEINSSSSVHAPKADALPSNAEKNADITTKGNDFTRNWKNIASSFLKVGVTYGQMWAVMQAELQEKQQWVSKERFVEGLSLVNMLPGAPGPQLAIILGYARGGMWGGLLAGLSLVFPAFFILLMLTMAYASLGVTPIGRGPRSGPWTPLRRHSPRPCDGSCHHRDGCSTPSDGVRGSSWSCRTVRCSTIPGSRCSLHRCGTTT